MTQSCSFEASDGTRLQYYVDDFTDPWRPAQTVVLLHPGMGSAQRMYAWIPHLARDFRVVRPDLRGHGKSQPAPGKAITNERFARDIAELLDQIGCEHVVGAAAGGIFGMHAAIVWLRGPASRIRNSTAYSNQVAPPSRVASSPQAQLQYLSVGYSEPDDRGS